jgi:hypothetical protein
LNEGLKYNLSHKYKHWLRNLAFQAETAITLLPTDEQAITLLPTDEQVITLLPTDEQAITLLPTDEQTITLLPTDEQAITLLPTDEQAITLLPTDEQAITLLPTDKQDHISYQVAHKIQRLCLQQNSEQTRVNIQKRNTSRWLQLKLLLYVGVGTLVIPLLVLTVVCSTIIQNIFTFTVTQSTWFTRRREINHLETYPLMFQQ